MGITIASSSTFWEFPSSDVTILEGHTSEVFNCSWSPAGSLLASGSGDSTARIWTIPDGPRTSETHSGPPKALVLKHNKQSMDVTVLDWNGEGTLLATGTYDGQLRIWSKDVNLYIQLLSAQMESTSQVGCATGVCIYGL